MHPNFAEHVVAAAAESFRVELEAAIREKLRPEMEALLEHTVREVADTVNTNMVARYDMRRMGHVLTQQVIIGKT